MYFYRWTKGLLVRPGVAAASGSRGAYWRGLATCWLCCSLSGFCLAEKTGEVTKAVLWTGSMTPARAAYETKVVRLALEKSTGKYGPYLFRVNPGQLSTQRVERAMLEGVELNIASSPVWKTAQGEAAPMSIIPIPIARGLLGYRRCIVRKEDLPRFAQIETLEDLQQLTAGLGTNWTELDVFQLSGLKWHGGKDIPQLHSMLVRSRFDYLPLGIVEAESSLARSAHKDELAIAPDLIIFYPLPIFIQVSVGQPLLAERLEHGLRRAIADGSLDTLFSQHFAKQIKELSSPTLRVITLENPNVPPFIQDFGPVLVNKRPGA